MNNMSVWPPLISITLLAIGLGVNVAKHGQSHGPYDAGPTILGTAIAFTLLWWGGFFAPLFH